MFGLKAIKCDALERRSISLGAQFPQKQTIVTFLLHFPRTAHAHPSLISVWNSVSFGSDVGVARQLSSSSESPVTLETILTCKKILWPR